MSRPELTADRARELLSYDPDTGELRWRVTRATNAREGDLAGCLGRQGYREMTVEMRTRTAHRIAWLIVHGRWPLEELDHINGDRADNRLCNLREATHAQNQRNRVRVISGRNPNTSGYKGVTWHGERKQWMARIRVNGTRKTIGRFPTAEEAHAAYCAAARRHYGEFARTN